MGKEIKLHFTNYNDTINLFGDDQKEFHQECFDIALRNWFSNRIELSYPVQNGILYFKEAENTETHVILKYLYKEV